MNRPTTPERSFGSQLQALRREVAGAFDNNQRPVHREGSTPFSQIDARGTDARDEIRMRLCPA